MNPNELANDVSAIPFLKGMSDRHIGVLAAVHADSYVKRHDHLSSGATANRFYLIERGECDTRSCIKSANDMLSQVRFARVCGLAGPGCSSRTNGSSPRGA